LGQIPDEGPYEVPADGVMGRNIKTGAGQLVYGKRPR
jgi:hypothetical protein